MPPNTLQAIYDVLGIPEAHFPGTLPQASGAAIPGRIAALQELNRYIAAPEEPEITEAPPVGRMGGQEKAALILSILGDVLRTISTAKKGKAEPFQYTPQALGQIRGKRLGEALRARSEREGRRVGAAKWATLEREDIIRAEREEDIAQRATTAAERRMEAAETSRNAVRRRMLEEDAKDAGVMGRIREMGDEDLIAATRDRRRELEEAKERRADTRIGFEGERIGMAEVRETLALEAAERAKAEAEEKKRENARKRKVALEDVKDSILSRMAGAVRFTPEGVVLRNAKTREETTISLARLRSMARADLLRSGGDEKDLPELNEFMHNEVTKVWSEKVGK